VIEQKKANLTAKLEVKESRKADIERDSAVWKALETISS